METIGFGARRYLALNKKLRLGFDLVHHEIESAPFCEENQQITKITACRKCNSCEKNNLCYLCFKKGKKHFLGYPVFDLEDVEFGYNKLVFLKHV